MPGDDYLEGGPSARVAMTRAISIQAPSERVWPWIAQLGRGAGWYSVEWLDNGRKVSALAWWVSGLRFAGSETRLVAYYGLQSESEGTRLVSRMSADAAGPLAHITLFVFRVIDSIMASRQLIGIRERAESCEADPDVVPDPETGLRDQYQLYEVLYAAGGRAGVAGKESGARWRESAMKDGILEGGRRKARS
jgi:hypothetical protein